MNVLGIDLGTSQAKAMVCAPDGAVLGRGAAGYDVSTPQDGWAETDPALWWRAVRAAVSAAVAASGVSGASGASAGPGASGGPGASAPPAALLPPAGLLPPAPPAARAEVSAIAVTGQMHGVVLISELRVVLRPAITWLDRRATAEAANYYRLDPALLSALGNAPAPGMAGPLLAWLAEHEPGAYAAARWQFQPKDWLRFCLTGVPATDPTDASGTLLYDLRRDAWAADVIDFLGLRPELLPPVQPGSAPAGPLLPEPAAELGLPAGIPVLTGVSDTAASLLAARLPGPEWALLTLGTGGQWIMPCGADAAPDPSGRTSLFRAADGGLFRLGGAQNVGITLNWVRSVLAATWDDLYASAAISRTSRPPFFAPELVTERPSPPRPAAPAAGPGVPGAGWSGVTLAHTRDDLMRAALVGVAGLLRQRLDDLRAAGCAPEQVMLGGGGSRHQAWRDLLSAELGLPLHPAGTPWLTAKGAAMLAARLADNA